MRYTGAIAGSFISALLGAFGLLRGEVSAPLASSDGHKVVSLDVTNYLPKLPVMTFFVRYPQGLSPKDKVDGVFADVTWISDKDKLKKWAMRPSKGDRDFEFADRHKLVVLSWTTATMYSISNSFTEDANEERDPYNLMETCFRTWTVGIDRLCSELGLPRDGYFIDGASRGAQWAHRIVLRNPERFLAVHIHINSSFEEPTPQASRCLWLLTTGELEHGSVGAKEFFRKAVGLDYPILLRIYPGRGHEVFPEEVNLGIDFFEYAIQLRDEEQKILDAKKALHATLADSQPFTLESSLLKDFHNPPYYGDMLNGDVYPASQVTVLPESQRVGLPTRALAKCWGYLHP